MPFAGGSVVLAANVESANQLAGNIEEFITRPSYVRLTAVTNLVPLGTAATVTSCKLLIGRTVLINGQQLPGVNTATSGINLKDHIVTEHAGLRGRIFLSFTSGATPVVFWRLDITPLA
jgi:hypothetical protein